VDLAVLGAEDHDCVRVFLCLSFFSLRDVFLCVFLRHSDVVFSAMSCAVLAWNFGGWAGAILTALNPAALARPSALELGTLVVRIISSFGFSAPAQPHCLRFCLCLLSLSVYRADRALVPQPFFLLEYSTK
jgi:hypothetical protein